MLSAIDIKKMSTQEKLKIMEAIWADLEKDEEMVESPAWHEDALRETERRVAAGDEGLVDWEIAKKELRSRFE